jgi:SAM domain (Sterile alpha motif)
MQQIADWLEKLGMSEYAQRFAENGITVAALRHLTDQDLKDIMPVVDCGRVVGIVSIGDIVKHRLHEMERESAAIAST